MAYFAALSLFTALQTGQIVMVGQMRDTLIGACHSRYDRNRDDHRQ
jgi:hypothetical protein